MGKLWAFYYVYCSDNGLCCIFVAGYHFFSSCCKYKYDFIRKLYISRLFTHAQRRAGINLRLCQMAHMGFYGAQLCCNCVVCSMCYIGPCYKETHPISYTICIQSYCKVSVGGMMVADALVPHRHLSRSHVVLLSPASILQVTQRCLLFIFNMLKMINYISISTES